ncbi:MAG: hypothetical protein V4505_22725 [Pseudomonadota bacterium]
MKNNFTILAAVLLLPLAGCVNRVPVDAKLAALIPRSAALKILSQNLSAEWVATPYVEKYGMCNPKGGRESIVFSDIKGIMHVPATKEIVILKERGAIGVLGVGSCFEQVIFPMESASAAEETTTALRSLGACTSPKSFFC